MTIDIREDVDEHNRFLDDMVRVAVPRLTPCRSGSMSMFFMHPCTVIGNGLYISGHPVVLHHASVASYPCHTTQSTWVYHGGVDCRVLFRIVFYREMAWQQRIGLIKHVIDFILNMSHSEK